MNPSVSAALKQRSEEKDQKDSTGKISCVPNEMPWIYPPWQTWAYVAGLVVLCVLVFRTWRAGLESIRLVQQKHFAPETPPAADATQHKLITLSEQSKEEK